MQVLKRFFFVEIELYPSLRTYVQAVIYVEALQTVVMVIGSTVLTVLAFQEIAAEGETGWNSMWEKYNCSIPSDYKDESMTDTGVTCGGIRDDFDHLIRDPIDSDMPWPGAIFGLTVIARKGQNRTE